jgi:GT2 family glycosyltransferase
MTPVATVVVVTWNGAHLLPPCLDALAEQTLGPDSARILVVDNASTDDTSLLLSQYRDLKIVRSPRNLGFAGGATLGLSQVSTQYAVVLNNDARPEPEWLEHLLEGFDDCVAAVTSKVLLVPRYAVVPLPRGSLGEQLSVSIDGKDLTNSVVAHQHGEDVLLAVPAPDGTDVAVVVTSGDGHVLVRTEVPASQPRVDILNSTGGLVTPTGHGADRGYLEIDNGQYDDAVDVFAVCGAAAAFRTDVGRALGWFDPWYFAYYEDLDLSWRLRRAGWQVRYAATARVRHEHAATSRVGSDLFLFHNRRNRLATLVRNATLRELVAALASSRVTESVGGTLLENAGNGVAGRPPRPKVAALASFLMHLPALVTGRLRSSRRADLSPGASAWQQPSPPAAGA